LGYQIEKSEIGGTCSTYGGEERVLLRNLRDRYHLEDPGVDVRIILRWTFRKWDGGKWTGLIWLRIGTGGRHL
jgi:hypothetical protein